MDSHSQKTPATGASAGDEGYGSYGSYNAQGYGYGGYGGEGGGTHRSLGDYLLVLRERIWYIVVVFLVVFSSVLVFTFSQTKIYQSTATVEILRRDPVGMKVEEVVARDIRGAEDLNTLIKVIESGTIVQKVAERITGDDLRKLMAPYETGKGGPLTAGEVLGPNRRILPIKNSMIIGIQFRHPDRQVAAKVANLFVDEFMAYNARVRIDESMRVVEDLKIRAEQQKRKVEDLALTLQSYREKNNMISLEKSKDIVTEKLKALNAMVTQTSANLDDARIRWKQVQDRVASGGDLAELPFIASQPLIGQLTQQIATLKITAAQLRERYLDKHPKLIEAVKSLSQTETELQRALQSASASIQSEYETALKRDQEARTTLAQQEAQSLETDRAAVEYESIEREFLINEQLLQHLIGRIRELSMTNNMESQSARIVDRALPSLDGDYIQPNYPLNLSLGFVGGLGLGLAFAFFVALVDDRVKSSFDIESVVGVPLIGIIPQIKKMDQPDKAQIVINNADRQVSESFLALHSSLRLRDDSKNAQCFLTTSTIPGEGKSFTTTNLALTYAAHGERVVIVDCDLRKPNIHKSFRRENLKGVIDVCAGTATVDDVVIKDVHPNLDIIGTGGRAKNPTQVLNSKNFELMVLDLRKRYDRIFIDTPPLAAVTDALIILPLVDGSLFTIFFNKVRRKAAQHAARKLFEANVPVFGAVLNGLNLAISGYYYAQYYDKSYKDYYLVMSPEEEAAAGKDRG